VVDVPLVIAGALLAIWPLTYLHQMRKIHARIAMRGGDVERFRQTMDRRWIRAALIVVPVVGAAIVVLGVTGR
jgi:hypothetical protein